ncbi:sugar transferase [Chitinophaga sp. 30R24]|uniref:sugar transferase n=1 Tax=Chitinophaga sp. 30R24 TaxID=3248838 RepID=UPI003B90BD4A
MHWYKNIGKPLQDGLIALIALLLLAPVLLLLTLLLAVANNGKPFFLQPRPGRNRRIFRVIKFKTMNDRKDAGGQLLPDEIRLTPIGRFVRKTSLDEIPQLINVLKGDMSLVGPRPLLVDYLPLYNETQLRRHEVRPGITGWAQVNGRNAISWQQKFEYDVWYVNHLSPALDWKILGMTVQKVLKSEGISAANVATMERFMGNG